MNNLPCLALLYLALLVPVGAQDENAPPPPQAPFTRLPERAAWEVDVTTEQASDTSDQSQSQPAKGRQLIHIDSIKTGDIKHDYLYYSDGTREEVWYRRGFLLLKSSDGLSAQVLRPNSGNEVGVKIESVYSGGLPGVAWISASDYQKPDPQGSSLCYYFERKEKGKVAGQAWIDVHTWLPVVVQIHNLKYVFNFKTPPDGDLTLPSPYAEAWQKFGDLEARRFPAGQ